MVSNIHDVLTLEICLTTGEEHICCEYKHRGEKFQGIMDHYVFLQFVQGHSEALPNGVSLEGLSKKT